MNDDDIDTRLRDHGTAWREANQDRPAVEWDRVATTRRWRGWLAVGAVAAAAAAIIVPLALTAGSRTTTAPTPGGRLTVAMKGAPANFFATSRGKVWEVYFSTAPGPLPAGSDSDRGGQAVALGVASDAQTAYAAYDGYDRAGGCRTDIERHHLVRGGASLRHVLSIAGRAAQVPMAVSPDGHKLALVVLQPDLGLQRGPGCGPVEELVVIDLRTHSVARSRGLIGETLRSLQWSPDSRELAYDIAPGCAGCHPAHLGSHVMTVAEQPQRDDRSTPVLPPGPAAEPYGPVFWWHGELVTVFKGSLMRILANGRLREVTGNFPMRVDSVSSDPTGDHLLLGSGATTYRWDNGHLSVVKGHWAQPGW